MWGFMKIIQSLSIILKVLQSFQRTGSLPNSMPLGLLKMKAEILSQLMQPQSTIRVVFATVALGMGVDIQHIQQIHHIMVPRTIEEYYEEIGRAERDRMPAIAKMFFNGSDIASNKEGMTETMRLYCLNNTTCPRQCLLNNFGQDCLKSLGVMFRII